MRYEIEGNNLPVVICHLEEGEKIITEQGAMAWMTPNMKMETNSNGIGRAVARTFSGESFFQNIYYPCRGRGKGMIAFASSFPGTIEDCYVCEKNITWEDEDIVPVYVLLEKRRSN